MSEAFAGTNKKVKTNNEQALGRVEEGLAKPPPVYLTLLIRDKSLSEECPNE